MSTYSDTLDTLVAAVNAAGLATPDGTLHATRDPSQVQQGQITLLIVVQSIDYSAMCADGTPDIVGLLVGIAADPSMSALLDLVDAVVLLIGGTTVNRATWTPPGGDALPCFQIATG